MTAVVSTHRPRRSVPRPSGSTSTLASRRATVWASTAGSSALAPTAEPLPALLPVAPPLARPAVELSRPAAPVRLTRRGRLVATLIAAAVAALLCLTLGPAVASGVLTAFSGAPTTATTTVTVEPGQSLWQVAVATDPGSDPAQVVMRIADANGLTSATALRPGQRLVVPVS